MQCNKNKCKHYNDCPRGNETLNGYCCDYEKAGFDYYKDKNVKDKKIVKGKENEHL